MKLQPDLRAQTQYNGQSSCHSDASYSSRSRSLNSGVKPSASSPGCVLPEKALRHPLGLGSNLPMSNVRVGGVRACRVPGEA